MSEGPGDLHHHPTEEYAHDVAEIREDLAFERETLDESIRHDYSTSDTGIVPLDRRRPIWHFPGFGLRLQQDFRSSSWVSSSTRAATISVRPRSSP